MGNPNASVDNVSCDVGASRVVEDVVLSTDGLVGEADQARGSIRLGNEGGVLDLGVGLNVSNLFGVKNVLDHDIIGIEGHGTPGVHAEGVDGGRQLVAEETSLSEVALRDLSSKLGLFGRDGLLAKRVVVDDNVAVGNDVLGKGVGDEAHEMRQVDVVDDVTEVQGLTIAVKRDSSRQGGNHHEEICEHGAEGRHFEEDAVKLQERAREQGTRKVEY